MIYFVGKNYIELWTMCTEDYLIIFVNKIKN